MDLRGGFRAVAGLFFPLLVAGGCAEILGIEQWEEQYPSGGTTAAGGAGGGGASQGGSAGEAAGGSGTAGAGCDEAPWTLQESGRYGGALAQSVSDLALDPTGNVVLVGQYVGELEFDPHSLPSPDEQDAFVVKLSAQIKPQWAQPLAGGLGQYANGLAIGGAHNIVVVGHFFDSVDLGNEVLHSEGEQDGFVAKYDPMGEPLWSRHLLGPSTVQANDVALDWTDGSVVVVGDFDGSMHCEMDAVPTTDGLDIFVARLSGAGSCTGSRSYGGAGEQKATAVAIDPTSQDVVIAGCNAGTMTLGAEQWTNAGGEDIFVAKLNAIGVPTWSHQFGGIAKDTPAGIVIDDSGVTYLAGQFHATASFGGEPQTTAGQTDIVVLALAPDGAIQWSAIFGGGGRDIAGAIALAPTTDSVMVTGAIEGSVTFDSHELDCGPGRSVFVAELSPENGDCVRAACFGGDGDRHGGGIAASANGELWLTGQFTGTMSLCKETLVSAGETDIFLATFLPTP